MDKDLEENIELDDNNDNKKNFFCDKKGIFENPPALYPVLFLNCEMFYSIDDIFIFLGLTFLNNYYEVRQGRLDYIFN